MNNYTKLLTDLIIVDVDIKEEDKTLILLNSLPDEEYKTFVLTLDKAALLNYEVRNKDKQSSFNGTTAETMTTRGMGLNRRKGKEEFEKSKTSGHEELKKDQCAFCREGYWKIDYPKIKPKESKSEANIA